MGVAYKDGVGFLRGFEIPLDTLFDAEYFYFANKLASLADSLPYLLISNIGHYLKHFMVETKLCNLARPC